MPVATETPLDFPSLSTPMKSQYLLCSSSFCPPGVFFDVQPFSSVKFSYGVDVIRSPGCVPTLPLLSFFNCGRPFCICLVSSARGSPGLHRCAAGYGFRSRTLPLFRTPEAPVPHNAACVHLLASLVHSSLPRMNSNRLGATISNSPTIVFPSVSTSDLPDWIECRAHPGTPRIYPLFLALVCLRVIRHIPLVYPSPLRNVPGNCSQRVEKYAPHSFFSTYFRRAFFIRICADVDRLMAFFPRAVSRVCLFPPCPSSVSLLSPPPLPSRIIAAHRERSRRMSPNVGPLREDRSVT